MKTSVSWYDIHKQKQSKNILFNLPTSVESAINEDKKESKGLGMDRFICKTINEREHRTK